jgi:hypothetical protein
MAGGCPSCGLDLPPHARLAQRPAANYYDNGNSKHAFIGGYQFEWQPGVPNLSASATFSSRHEGDADKACCIPINPGDGREHANYDPCQPEIKIPRKVLKGGAHLRAPKYCRRDRPAARSRRAGGRLDKPCGFPSRCSSGDDQRAL